MRLDLSNKIDVKKAETYFETLLSNNKQIELKELKKVRTIKHNAYLHVVISIYAINFGYTLDESKTLLKRMCDFMIYEKEGVKFLKKTSKMLDSDLSKFIDWIRNHASINGLYIPNPKEYLDNKFTIDKEINNQKQYL